MDKHKSKLRYATVCSGIGAPEVAAAALGWECIFSADIEPFANAVRAHHWPAVPNLGDMTKFKKWPKRCICTQCHETKPTTFKIGRLKLTLQACAHCGGINIDLLIAGTPCQAFSIAGLRAGLADPRGNLTLILLGLIDRYRPRWILWENVPGVHSSWSDEATFAPGAESIAAIEKALADLRRAGLDDFATVGPGEFEEVDQSNDFDSFLAGLDQLGYGTATRILDAQYFGVAQRRRRVFVVAHIGGQWQRAAAVLFERESLSGHPAPRRETGKGFTHAVAPSIGASGRGTERAGETRGQDPVIAEMLPIGVDGTDIGFALRANASHSGDKGDGGVNTTMVAEQVAPAGHHAKRQVAIGNDARAGRMRGREGCAGGGKGPLLSEEQSLTLAANANDQVLFQPQVAPCLKINNGQNSDASMEAQSLVVVPEVLAHGQSGAEHVKDGSPSLTCNHEAPIAFIPALAIRTAQTSANGHGIADDVAHTIDQTHGQSVAQGGRHASAMAVRRLTPRECERLQGFPDDFTAIKYRGKPAADGPRYKALGNSMAVPNIKWIFQRIELVNAL